MTHVLRRVLVLAAIGFSSAAFGQPVAPLETALLAEEGFYEPFDPNAERLVFTPPSATLSRTFDFRRRRFRNEAEASLFAAPAQFGLEIYVFQVGQADSMLIVGPGPARKSLLIDLGVSRHAPFNGTATAEHVGQRIVEITGKTHVDYFLLSHFHTDHFGNGNSGVTTLLAHSNITFGTVIDTGDLSNRVVDRKQEAREYIGRMAGWRSSGKIRGRVVPRFGTQSIRLGTDVSVDILAFGGRYSADRPTVHEAYEVGHPRHFTGDDVASENDLSIALEVSLGNFEFWTGGDLSGASGNGTSPLSGSGNAYTNVEFPMTEYWRQTGRESDVEIYRANHHGAAFSTTPQLLDALDPEHVLYSAHKGHGHPNDSLAARVFRTARQYATDIDPEEWPSREAFVRLGGRIVGEIQILVSRDGSSYAINGEPFRSYSDAEEQAGMDMQP